MSLNIRIIVIMLSMSMIILIMVSCESSSKKGLAVTSVDVGIDDTAARAKLMSLLSSLEERDIESFRTNMASADEMDLILTNGDIITSVDSFVELHRGWFQDTTWSIRHELVDFKFYGNFATSTVKAYYNEPDRNGRPYFHNMLVSYVLRQADDGDWMIIKDQATTFDKSLSE